MISLNWSFFLSLLFETKILIFLLPFNNFSKDKKKYLFYSSVLDQTRLIEDIFRDGSIKKAFLNKTIEAENIKGTVEDLKVHLVVSNFKFLGGSWSNNEAHYFQKIVGTSYICK